MKYPKLEHIRFYKLGRGTYRFYAGSLEKNILIDFYIGAFGLGFRAYCRRGLNLSIWLGPLCFQFLWTKRKDDSFNEKAD